MCDFLILWHATQFSLERALIGNRYVPSPKIIWFKFLLVVQPIFPTSVSNSCKDFPPRKMCRYWILSAAVVAPISLMLFWKYHTNSGNSSGSLFSKKGNCIFLNIRYSWSRVYEQLTFYKTRFGFINFLITFNYMDGGWLKVYLYAHQQPVFYFITFFVGMFVVLSYQKWFSFQSVILLMI